MVILLTEGSGSQPVAQRNGRRTCLADKHKLFHNSNPQNSQVLPRKQPHREGHLACSLPCFKTQHVKSGCQHNPPHKESAPTLCHHGNLRGGVAATSPGYQEMGDAGGRGDGRRRGTRRWRETGGSKGRVKSGKVYQERRDGRPGLTQEKGGVGRRRKTPMMMRRRGGNEAAWPHFPCKSLSSTSSFRRLWVRREGTG